MFGDTTHSVIVDKVAERPGGKKTLTNLMLDCFKDINLNVENQDIENIERIAVVDPNRNKNWPRPIKIIYRDKYLQDQVLFFKLRLRHSSTYHEFKISSAILALLDKDDDLRARHELLNTERIL